VAGGGGEAPPLKDAARGEDGRERGSLAVGLEGVEGLGVHVGVHCAGRRGLTVVPADAHDVVHLTAHRGGILTACFMCSHAMVWLVGHCVRPRTLGVGFPITQCLTAALWQNLFPPPLKYCAISKTGLIKFYGLDTCPPSTAVYDSCSYSPLQQRKRYGSV